MTRIFRLQKHGKAIFGDTETIDFTLRTDKLTQLYTESHATQHDANLNWYRRCLVRKFIFSRPPSS